MMNNCNCWRDEATGETYCTVWNKWVDVCPKEVDQ